MFKRPSVRYGRTPAPETPYQKAAQVWDERIGSARVQASNWRSMAFGCLLLSGGLASALVWQSVRGTVTPWVVQVDRLGQAQAVAPADSSYQPTDPQIAFHLAHFIEDVRGLPADAIVLRQDWLRSNDPLPIWASCRFPSRSPASSGRRRPRSALPGFSVFTRTAA